MRVCVVGSGGREHALGEALARTAKVVVTPGNALIPWSANADPLDVYADLWVIGPEAPLVDGLADRLRAKGHLVLGPGADGARLEGSKEWMKEVLVAAGVPTARHGSFGADDLDAALAFLRSLPGLYVVKTDGLAAGKGVLVTTDLAEAEDDVRSKLSGEAFGEAGTRVVIEEGLSGPEVSLLCLADGERVVPLPSAQDAKRLRDGDAGPNTGGMGAYSPVPAVDDARAAELADTLVAPTLHELRRRGIDYRGVLYAGLMLTPDGPKVLEYNVRFGDPETQVILPRLDGDVVELLRSAADGRLGGPPTVKPDAAVTVVCAVEGYPLAPRFDAWIDGLDAARALPGVSVYGAGVALGRKGRIVTAGGRALSVTALAPTITDARARAYEAVRRITWPGMQYRTDIAAHPTPAN